jgi:hypothetical protein
MQYITEYYSNSKMLRADFDLGGIYLWNMLHNFKLLWTEFSTWRNKVLCYCSNKCRNKQNAVKPLHYDASEDPGIMCSS